ncbi:hypothetical protein OIU74_024212 [Salix koriyanagi]|uniref:Uncharacterized protein n=1 Tax=Salix koriyanagi TaxID=2511006 RepID=A0A9Q0W9I1_9ROSI|nr:hypothetical protein OIU74_024212 [Salix koriyanagi]
MDPGSRSNYENKWLNVSSPPSMRLPYKLVKNVETETLNSLLELLEGRRLLLFSSKPLHLSNNLIELIVGADGYEETGVKLF